MEGKFEAWQANLWSGGNILDLEGRLKAWMGAKGMEGSIEAKKANFRPSGLFKQRPWWGQ